MVVLINCEIIQVIRDNELIDSWGNRCDVGEKIAKNISKAKKISNLV